MLTCNVCTTVFINCGCVRLKMATCSAKNIQDLYITYFLSPNIDEMTIEPTLSGTSLDDCTETES